MTDYRKVREIIPKIVKKIIKVYPFKEDVVAFIVGQKHGLPSIDTFIPVNYLKMRAMF